MKNKNKIISILLTVVMLMGLMTSVSFAAQTTLPTTFGWSTENPGNIILTIPSFSGDEVEYEFDLYKDGTKVDAFFSNIFDASGEFESDIFLDEIKRLGDGTYTYKIGLTRDWDTDELLNCTNMSSAYVKSNTGTGGDTSENQSPTITFMVNGTVHSSYQGECGEYISFPTVSVDGYWFKGWDKPRNYIIPDEDITVNAILHPLATITGRLLNEDGTAASSAQVNIKTYKNYGSNNGYVYALCDANGDFSIEYPQGEHILAISNWPIYSSVEVNADNSTVDLGNIVLGRKALAVSVNAQVETMKGFGNLLDSFITSEDEEFLSGNENTISLTLSVGLPVVRDDEEIAKSIAFEYGSAASVMYFDALLSKVGRYEDGNFTDSIYYDESPQLLEFKIKIPDDMLEKEDYAFVRTYTTQTDDVATETIDTITKTPNEFGEYYTIDGEYIRLFAKRFSIYALVGFNEADIPVHKNITYMVGNSVFRTDSVVVGSSVPDMPANPVIDGYTFVKWDTELPEVMPDNDIVVSAILTKVENLNSSELLTEEEIANGYTVEADVSLAADNTTVETALVNSYSEYTAALKLDITLEKTKVGEEPTEITETNNLITFTIDIPADVQGKAEYIIIREHEGVIDALTTRANSYGEYIEIQGNKIALYAKRFSTYVLLAKDSTPTYFGGGGGVSKYTVKFETNGGNTIKSISAKRNTVVAEPTAPVKEGYTFDGWYSDKELTSKFDFATKITKSITLYAKWNEVPINKIILTIGQKEALVNGETILNDVAPKIVNERTMLPIRFIAEKLGATVDWVQESRTVIVELDDIKISLVIGESFATVNGEKIELDSPSFVEDGRTFLPIRFVMENLGADVLWDNDTQTVTITK